ncbi:hypothetical protein PCC9214_03438 [Planktothrix tepida]|uniref:Uncharacterized protein n=2 Tax=Planktothrix TaxID=54304 RepID=A0A1J1LTV8_9CYAN|nr:MULTISPECIES: hypothetical protein [Planktothrix]CAD5945694.1 hypothetical protein NO713_02217 [Planktothrix pseudagardhii]CAD5965052.1 hypothetical protein PCC9214_03438 [Planktothrix tepida]CUR34985.1 hypothetical protein PL9214650424 [Planktothrix tepida PCC 9214]
MEPRDYENSLARSDNSSIQKYNKNPITSAIGSVVKLEESVKTYLDAESSKSLIINAEHEAWSEYERLNG